MIGLYLAVLAAALTVRVFVIDGVVAAALTVAASVCVLGLLALVGTLPARVRRAAGRAQGRP